LSVQPATLAGQPIVVAEQKQELSKIVVEAVLNVATKNEDGYRVDIDDVKIQKKGGELP